MQWILEPAAEGIWDSAGTIITADGRTELAPTTDAGWDDVRKHATILAEAANLLLLPGRAAGPDWIAYAQALRTTGRQALAAAQARDADALFDAGGQIYQACVACHTQYWVPAGDATSGD
jgi:mono/diheme cytochrome c family protein